MANILVTGATGLLGSRLVPFLKARGHQITCLGHTQAADLNADLTNHEETTRALNQAKPEVIVNLAGLTNVDRCETHPQEAYLLNVKSVENISSWIKAAQTSCHLIHISSDQLYDGEGPHAEGELKICNSYAMSKLAGEFAVGTASNTILRTNFVGRSLREARISFTDWLHTALCGTTPINVFEDVMFSPLAIHTLCDCIDRSISDRPSGIFNLGSRNGMSKADFAFAFAAATKLPISNLVRCSSTSAAKLTPRPNDMRMRCERFEDLMMLKLPQLIDEIQVVARDYI